jgi:hypothetical protein
MNNFYTFAQVVPQDTPTGYCPNIDEIAEKKDPVNDLARYIPNLAWDAEQVNDEARYSFKIYAGSGYTNINRQMRNPVGDNIELEHYIKNISESLHTYGFNHSIVRLFRTEGSDYQQEINGSMKSSRKLSIGDSWTFPAFISTAVTNQPSQPKCQFSGKLTLFVFEFNKGQDIKGLYLDQSLGSEGECEFLLAPGVAKVTNAYKQKIGFGLMVVKVKFVVCNLNFPSIQKS